jgi:hypothetical protein
VFPDAKDEYGSVFTVSSGGAKVTPDAGYGDADVDADELDEDIMQKCEPCN